MKKIFIKQVKSSIGCLPKHKATLKGLGLRRIGHTVQRNNTLSVLGMINQVKYLVQVSEKEDITCI